jgi:hypothetical protein
MCSINCFARVEAAVPFHNCAPTFGPGMALKMLKFNGKQAKID